MVCHIPITGNNALYLSLLQEHHSHLVSTSSLAQSHYATAIDSLNRCPVPFGSIDALAKLEGFSPGIRRKLQQMIEEKGGEEVVRGQLEIQRASKRARQSLLQNLEEIQGEVVSEGNASSSSAHKDASVNVRPTGTAKTKPTAKDPAIKGLYMPPQRSGSWGLLMGLYLLSSETEADDEDQFKGGPERPELYFLKDTLISKSQKYSRSSYTFFAGRRGGASAGSRGGRGGGSSGASSFATAWNTMKTLLSRGLVYQKGRPATYALSKEGWRVATEIAKREGKLRVGTTQDDENETLATTTTEQGETSEVALPPPPPPPIASQSLLASLDRLDCLDDPQAQAASKTTTKKAAGGAKRKSKTPLLEPTEPKIGSRKADNPPRRVRTAASDSDSDEDIFKDTPGLAPPTARDPQSREGDTARLSAHPLPPLPPPPAPPLQPRRVSNLILPPKIYEARMVPPSKGPTGTGTKHKVKGKDDNVATPRVSVVDLCSEGDENNSVRSLVEGTSPLYLPGQSRQSKQQSSSGRVYTPMDAVASRRQVEVIIIDDDDDDD